MFDIFYSGVKPGLFAHEQQADDLQHARELATTRYFWWINYLTDYSGFDFLSEPPPWQSTQQHVWPSQHQANGETLLVPKQLVTDANYNHEVLFRHSGVPVVGIDHGTGVDYPCDYTTRFIDNYLGTLRRILSRVEEESVWVVSSVCDYTGFDFTWHPSEWQQDMLHVFASDEQPFGDTFYIHVPSFLAKSQDIKLLEWFDTLHFVPDIQVPRRNIPQIVHTYDTHVQAVWQHEFRDPVVAFSITADTSPVPAVNLWREETRTIVPLSAGASRVVVPRDAKNYLRSQLYDYPYIDKTHYTQEDPAADVVFISNGEPMAEENWQNLQRLCPRAKHSKGVAGRTRAYQAAAQLSTTPWFYAVFAKTEVLDSFGFDFQPDRLQAPKHYIFHSRNPLNGLEYGAMNINLYNRQLVLDTVPGIDFTLSAAHEVVPICASISRFNTDPWITWRSAFREVLKLKQESDLTANVETQYRLRVWCQQAEGLNAESCLQGANDALEYYAEVAGAAELLKLSFDWAWLQDYYYKKYNCRPWLELV